jgi:hypothetical protein
MTVPLAFDKAQPLAPEELQAARAALLAWAGKASGLDGKTLEEKLRLTRGDRVPLYQVTLESLLESRVLEPEWTLRPITPDIEPAKTPVKRDQVNVWDAPRGPLQFSTHTESCPIPGTFASRMCMGCDGHGHNDCGQCDASGRSRCPHCQGKGRMDCNACRGMGKTNCLRCNGRGLNVSSTLLVTEKDACPSCHGEGKVLCTFCKEGQVLCSSCDATGRNPCEKCGSKGRVTCLKCEGKGQVLAGLSYQATFQLLTSSGIAAVEPIPLAILPKVFVKDRSHDPVEASAGDFSEESIRASTIPETLKSLLIYLLKDVKPRLSRATRLAGHRVFMANGEAHRLEGTFDGLPLVYWMHGQKKEVFPEKNPFEDLVRSLGEAARQAADQGRWPEAVALAEKALSYDGANEEARRLVRDWRRRVARETVGLSCGAGLAAALLAFIFILVFEKGIHKIYPGFLAASALFVLAGASGLAAFPLVRKRFQPRIRVGTVLGMTLGVLILFVSVVRGVFHWNGVKAADTAAFQKEWRERLPHGVSPLYWEPDLAVLEDLSARYKNTQVDLRTLKAELERQRRLKRDHVSLAQRFRKELAELTAQAPGLRVADRVARLRAMVDFYKIRNVDVSAGETLLKKWEAEGLAGPPMRRGPTVLKISVDEDPAPAVRQRKKSSSIRSRTPARRTRSSAVTRKKPAPVKKNPVKKTNRTRSSASGLWQDED